MDSKLLFAYHPLALAVMALLPSHGLSQGGVQITETNCSSCSTSVTVASDSANNPSCWHDVTITLSMAPGSCSEWIEAGSGEVVVPCDQQVNCEATVYREWDVAPEVVGECFACDQ